MSFQSLLEHFYSSTGIEFKENREIVNNKVTKFYKDNGYEDYNDFFTAIKKDPQLYQMLVNLLTTSETYFYREFHQIELCIDLLKENKNTIKILSAPCASGEEPYSLLIAMLQENINLENIQIYAIDINTLEIEKAKKGIFTHRRLHKLSPELQDKYFTALENGEYQIHANLQRHVHFKQMNLFDSFPREYTDFDVIFSRNMLIYFDQNAQEQAEKIFYTMLKEGGVLFVGHADKIHRSTGLQLQILKETHFYRK